MPINKEKMTRTTVSIPRDVYAMLERIAEEKKVSVSWVVRDAAERYIEERWPLFAHDLESGRE